MSRELLMRSSPPGASENLIVRGLMIILGQALFSSSLAWTQKSAAELGPLCLAIKRNWSRVEPCIEARLSPRWTRASVLIFECFLVHFDISLLVTFGYLHRVNHFTCKTVKREELTRVYELLWQRWWGVSIGPLQSTLHTGDKISVSPISWGRWETELFPVIALLPAEHVDCM